METKVWYHSKTLWVNFLAFVAVMAQVTTGQEFFDAEVQAALLVVINLILRIATGKPLGQ